MCIKSPYLNAHLPGKMLVALRGYDVRPVNQEVNKICANVPEMGQHRFHPRP